MNVEELVFKFSDELGPEKSVFVYDPKTGLKGMVVVDNVARGPAIGGVRMLPDVTFEEVFRLARAMTLKNAAAEIPHGGGKSGIIANPKTANRPELIRAFAKGIRHLVEYIPGPDMGTDEKCMAIILDEIGRACGLPKELGGIPLDEIGSTGYGVVESAEVACEFAGINLSGATIAVEGFGAVGKAAVKFILEKGAKVVAVSDSKGAIYNQNGLDYERLLKTKLETGAVKNYGEGQILTPEQIFELPVDILIPGARPDVISERNVHNIKCKLIVEAANIPATREAEKILHERGILVVPDFIANAGGVITAAVEYRGGTEKEAFEHIRDKVRRNTKLVLEKANEEGVMPRVAAEKIAKERVLNAMKYRGRL